MELKVNNAAETRTEDILLREDGVLERIVKDGVKMDIEDAIENIKAIAQIVGNKRHPVLVDLRRAKGVTRECRAYLSSAEPARYQLACAMLVDSGFSKLLGNFFLGLNKPRFPIRLFTTKEDALEWLNQEFSV